MVIVIIAKPGAGVPKDHLCLLILPDCARFYITTAQWAAILFLLYNSLLHC
jgi:hypothetical protein